MTGYEEPTYHDGDYVTDAYHMISGIAEQEKIEFYYAKEARPNYWYLWADVPNPGDHIYCGSTKIREEGFGGRTMTFPIGTGAELKLLGPWHTNSESLFNNIGVDLRDKHFTFGVIAEERSSIRGSTRSQYSRIVHIDEEPVIGTFKRIEDLAEGLTRRYGRSLYYYSKSHGGSISRRIIFDPGSDSS